jgi:hypothetical protein
LVLFGAASAFHVLVGGWSFVALGVAWLSRKLWAVVQKPTDVAAVCPTLWSLWPGVVVGLLLALPGLIPSLLLDWNADPKIVHQAHKIYVFERLPHHLVLTGMKPEFILRLVLLWGFWVVLPWFAPTTENLRRLRAFVVGAVCIALVGAAINLLLYVDKAMAADWLRYYWFRLTDVMIPLGVALHVGFIIDALWRKRPRMARLWLAAAMVVALANVGYQTIDRIYTLRPRSHKTADYEAWREACDWIVESGKIPQDATFITPRMAMTFKWYTGRKEVANWKDLPQDAAGLVKWWERIDALYATHDPPPNLRWHQALARRGEEPLRKLGQTYDADYLIAERVEPLLDFEVVYKNRTYVIYRLR